MINIVQTLLTAGDQRMAIATVRSLYVYHYFRMFPDVLLKENIQEIGALHYRIHDVRINTSDYWD